MVNDNVVIYPLFGGPDTVCVTDATRYLNGVGWAVDPDLIVFADNSSESMWAFDTTASPGGEYPVVELLAPLKPGQRAYLLRNSSFQRFVYTKVLYWTRYLFPEPGFGEPSLPWIYDGDPLLAAVQQLLDPGITLPRGEHWDYVTIEEIRASYPRILH